MGAGWIAVCSGFKILNFSVAFSWENLLVLFKRKREIFFCEKNILLIQFVEFLLVMHVCFWHAYGIRKSSR